MLTAPLSGEESVYVYDLLKLRQLYRSWTKMMPNITPYYAIKCNPNPRVLQCLAEMGSSFDCASPAEIKAVLTTGVDSERIIYANPCKKESDISYAQSLNVTKTTFDSICELEKIMRIAPETQLILRIYAADPTALCALSNKYGAFKEEWESILQRAAELSANVCGVSFHVGSGARDTSVYKSAIHQCCEFQKVATKYGFDIKLLDIGGGFTYETLPAIAKSIAECKSELACFSDVIAEPGRYFAERIATLLTKVVGYKKRINGTMDYWLTDGLYGSFNCSIYDHTIMTPIPLENTNSSCVQSTLWGPTCDGFDKVGVYNLPILKYGSWLVWENAGAYTVAGACDFNGINFTQPVCIYL